ncbi:S41 family peptidase [Mangrovivirga sp. M17]|uniref:S41 family peptidase n=1 Tax=Mangrovivirga halotolerans TaxID=2993936 RepID=A0ABT3RPK7_9BACT|nr:S41 family peptidase [Mangrovivirga halotolerans]MCX2743197.1 S41 family peptidase [Mangrovivirga halotolerans]
MKVVIFKKSNLAIKIFLMFLLVIGLSCTDEGPSKPVIDGDPISVWVYETMNEVYLWEDLIPSEIDLNKNPEAVFNEILYSGDRFSFLTNDYAGLINSLEGVSQEAGYEFQLLRVDESSTDIVALILYTKQGSPARMEGLRRGDVITAINGTALTTSNYLDLISQISETHTISYRSYDEGIGSYVDQNDLTLSTTVVSENPNFLDSVYTLSNGQKMGYFVYHFFSPGPGSTDQYDIEMDDIFAKFKAEGIENLVLDLRYNSGGSISSAQLLASLIAPGVTSNDILYKNVWNDLYMDYIQGLEDGDEILNGRFQDRTNNIGNSLSGQTLYVLVGNRTASASELIINGLRPYMNVVIIGESTVGKNVGSIPIQDENSSYGMLPIVFQIFNANNQSDYEQGFTPDFEVDEFASRMVQFGSLDDPLLSTAYNLIIGEPGRIAPFGKKFEGELIQSSIENKVWSNRLIFDKPIK